MKKLAIVRTVIRSSNALSAKLLTAIPGSKARLPFCEALVQAQLDSGSKC
jgi:hypothetical protein